MFPLHRACRIAVAGLFLISFVARPAEAQVASGGIVNVASFAPAGLPNAKIAQGALFAVFGEGLSDPGFASAGFPIPLELGGATVQVTVGSVTLDCPIAIAAPTRLTVLLPSATPVGEGTLTVRYGGQVFTETISVCPRSFGTLTKNQAGTGPASAQNFIEPSGALELNGLTSSAKTNQIVVVWGVGAGPVVGDEAAGPLTGDLQSEMDIQIYVGGVLVTDILYVGRSGCCGGLDQVIFRIPPGVFGCSVPVVIVIDGVPSNAATISIAESGSVCSDPHGYTSQQIIDISNAGEEVSAGIITLNHGVNFTSFMGAEAEAFSDFVGAGFTATSAVTVDSQIPPFNSVGLGSCITFSFFDAAGGVPNPIPFRPLDAGNLTIDHAGMQVPIPMFDVGSYSAQLASGVTPGNPGTPFYRPGTATITGDGGADVGPFEATIDLPGFVKWTNRDQITRVDRSQDLLITWSTEGKAADQTVIIQGGSSKLNLAERTVGSAFICQVPVASGQFPVPSYILSTLPRTEGPAAGVFPGFLFVGGNTFPVPFTATGLTYAATIFSSSDSIANLPYE